MTSIAFVEHVENFLKLLDSNEVLLGTLKLIVTEGDKILKLAFIAPTRNESNGVVNANNETRKAIETAIGAFKKAMRATRFSRSIDQLEEAIKSFYPALPNGEVLAPFYIKLIEDFREAYNNYVDSYNEAATLAMCRSAEMLYNALMRDKETLTNVKLAITPEPALDADYQIVKFHFEDKLTLGEMAGKLSSLERMYASMCAYMNVDYESHPLRVVKVESGTFDIIVSGWEAVMVVLTPQLLEAARLIFRNLANSDLKWMVNQIAAQIVIVNIKKRLEKHSAANAEMDRKLEEVSVQIAANMLEFVKSQGIRVNNESLKPTHFLTGPTLPAPEAKRLPDQTGSDENATIGDPRE